MKTEIYYFSGTGNSLHVAKEIRHRLPDSALIPIISALGQDRIETDAEVLGIVFPLQGPTYPAAVKFFLEKIDLSHVQYIFAVATRGGTTCRIREEIDKRLKRQGKQLAAHFIITVFNNDPKFKSGQKSYYCHPISPEELRDKTAEIQKKCDEISTVVTNRETYHPKDREYSFRYGRLIERFIIRLIDGQSNKAIPDYFYTDANCTGCGLCEGICLSDRISMEEGKPCWDDNIVCYMCYACLNFCPVSAVQIRSKWYMKSHTPTEKRYEHPYGKAKDIQKQKEGVDVHTEQRTGSSGSSG